MFGERKLTGEASRLALVALIGLIAVLPIWIPTFPAMCDAPQIAAQVAIYSQLNDPGFRFSGLFVRHTQTPNLSGYALVYALRPMMGVVAACKLAVSGALFLLLITWALLIAELGGDSRMALLTVPGFYGFPFVWGFIGFLTAAPIGVIFVILALRYFRRPTLFRAVGLALLLLFVFFCHAMIAAFAAALTGLYAVSVHPTPRELMRRLLPPVLVLLGAGIWWLRSIAANPITHKPTEWRIGWDRAADLMIDVTGWPGEMVAALILVALLAPVLLLTGVRRNLRCWLPVALCAAIALFAPHSLLGVDSVYERYALFMLPCLAIALPPSTPETNRRATWAVAWVAIFSLAWTAGVAWRMTVFEDEARGFSTLLREMQPGHRVLALSCNRKSKVFAGTVFLHHPAWYAALKNGVADPSFACGNVGLVHYRPEKMPAVRFADFEFHPQQFDWRRDQGSSYRYFVVRSREELGSRLFAGIPQVRLLAHEDEWWLYENLADDPS